MLVTVIAKATDKEVRKDIQRVIAQSDAIELRLDYLDHVDVADIQRLKHDFSIPMIFTLRKKSQGGLFAKTESERLILLEKLAALAPAFIDLEFDVAVEFATRLKQHYPKVQLIRSYHDFEKTPGNLAEILAQLRHPTFSVYKIVTYAQSTLDSLKVLVFVKTVAPDMKIASFCMGELGLASRVLSPIVGGALQYAGVDDAGQVASGQLSASTLSERYHVRSMNPQTHVYALLASPIAADKSAGHVVHNCAFEFLGKNAVYVKLGLESTELAAFFKLISLLPLKGLSVTMPFKQEVMPYLDRIDTHAHTIGSVNTIVIDDEGVLTGYNTDANAALDAIEDEVAVADKVLVIVGAGGTARAIGHEAIQRKARVIFLNRTAEKAHALAAEMHCQGHGLDEIALTAFDYDILVNTTPLGMAGQPNTLPIPQDFIIPKRVVMDTVYHPMHTLLTMEAQRRDCIVVHGVQMFINQAVRQLQWWFGGVSQVKALKHIGVEAFDKWVSNCPRILK